MLDQLSMRWRGRPHSIFRVYCLNILIGLLEKGIEIQPSFYHHGVKESIMELAKFNISYGADHPLSNALCHLDNTTLRVAHKSSLKLAMEKIKDLVLNQKNTLPIEELLKERPSLARNMIPVIGLSAEKLWRLFSQGSNPDHVWEGIWILEQFEELVDTLLKNPYPVGDGDLLFFESYGEGFDMLLIGTWDILNRSIKLLEQNNIQTDLIEFAKLDREEALKLIPKTKTCPPNWNPDVEILRRLQ